MEDQTKMDVNKVLDFWGWFNSNQGNFREHFENQELLSELDQWICSLGDFSWEVGPGIEKPNALIISPNGVLELLQVTKEIVSLAPKLDEWEFHYAKPPKNWELQFSIQDENENEIKIDANDWEYVLLKYPDNKFEILIKASQISGLSEDSKFLAVQITLDGILGEQRRMKFIDGVEIVTEFEDSYKGRASRINNLSKHLDKLI